MFPEACGLAPAWAGQAQWRILATGFGLGLEFLATWAAWRSDAQRPRLLHFVAIEARPASADDLLRGVAASPQLQPLAAVLAAQWSGLTPGFHRLSFEGGQVLLTVCVGELTAMLRAQAFVADTVFLHGVHLDGEHGTGSRETTKAVTRLARRGTNLVTSKVDEQVARDLQACGWQVERRAGPAPAPDCLSGRFEPQREHKGCVEHAAPSPDECVVVGAGLSGAAVAASLARRGWRVRVLDAAAAPAAGASGLPIGLLAPQQSPDDNPLSRLSRAGVRLTLREAQEHLAPGLEWERTGALEWRGEDPRMPPALGEALDPWTRKANAALKRRAGAGDADAAWWHENAAWIEPAALVRAWLRTPGVRFAGGCAVHRVQAGGEGWQLLDGGGALLAQSPLVIVAAALGTRALLPQGVDVHAVRGQVTWAPLHEGDGALPPFPVNGHGHLLPRVPLVDRGAWITGSSYGRGEDDTSVRGEDTAANLQRVAEMLPQAGEVLRRAAARGELRAWAGVRCASRDRRPLVGEVAPGLWASTAMGSRGLTFAALCAELLAARLHGEPLPLEWKLAQALDLGRQGLTPA